MKFSQNNLMTTKLLCGNINDNVKKSLNFAEK